MILKDLCGTCLALDDHIKDINGGYDYLVFTLVEIVRHRAPMKRASSADLPACFTTQVRKHVGRKQFLNNK